MVCLATSKAASKRLTFLCRLVLFFLDSVKAFSSSAIFNSSADGLTLRPAWLVALLLGFTVFGGVGVLNELIMCVLELSFFMVFPGYYYVLGDILF